MTVLTVLEVLESNLSSCCLSYKIQNQEAAMMGFGGFGGVGYDS